MQVRIFTVFDHKALAFAQPFFSPNNFSAMRAFSDACNDPSTMLCKHPGDFTLFCIGDFDDSLGSITSVNPPENLGLAASFAKDSA